MWEGFLEGLAPFLGIAILMILISKNIKLRKIISELKFRNPVEVDLELATHDQIMSELRKRPFSYMFILPQFYEDDNDESHLNAVMVEASGLSQEAAKDVISKACSVMCGGEGQWYKQE